MAGEVALAALPVRRESVYTPSSCMFSNFYLHNLFKQDGGIFIFAPCINSIKTLFIIPTDAHNYKIIGILKVIKIPTVTRTCFGSRRNHHQGTIQCLAKTIVMDLLCKSLLA